MKLFYLCCAIALQVPLMGADFSASAPAFQSVKRLTFDELQEALSLMCADRQVEVMAVQLNIPEEERRSLESFAIIWERVEGFYEQVKTVRTFPADFDREMLASFNARVEKIKLSLQSA